MLRSGKPTVLDINLCVCVCLFIHAFLELKHVTMQVEKRNWNFSSHDLKHWAEKWGKPTVLDVNLCVTVYTHAFLELKHITMQVEKWDWKFNSHDLNLF